MGETVGGQDPITCSISAVPLVVEKISRTRTLQSHVHPIIGKLGISGITGPKSARFSQFSIINVVDCR